MEYLIVMRATSKTEVAKGTRVMYILYLYRISASRTRDTDRDGKENFRAALERFSWVKPRFLYYDARLTAAMTHGQASIMEWNPTIILSNIIELSKDR